MKLFACALFLGLKLLIVEVMATTTGNRRNASRALDDSSRFCCQSEVVDPSRPNFFISASLHSEALDVSRFQSLVNNLYLRTSL